MRSTPNRKANRFAAVLTALILVGGGVFTAQTASAAHNCDQSGKACAWGYDNYTSIISRKAGGAGLTNLAIKNETASWGNDSAYYGCLYDNVSGTGASWTITPLSTAPMGIFDRDRAESWKLDGTGC